MNAGRRDRSIIPHKLHPPVDRTKLHLGRWADGLGLVVQMYQPPERTPAPRYQGLVVTTQR